MRRVARACTRRGSRRARVSPPVQHVQVRLGHRDDLAPQLRAAPPRRRTAARRSPRAAPERPCAARRARARRPGRSGQRRRSEPVAPAWSKWMCVSRIARGTSPPSASSSVSSVDCGPGSTRTPSTSQHADHLVDAPGAGRRSRAWRAVIPDAGQSPHDPPPAGARPPWMMRTYAGHSTAAKSNALYRGTSPRGRPGSRSPSTCRPRRATTPTTSWRAARSARSACRSATRATCGRCSTASRSTA